MKGMLNSPMKAFHKPELEPQGPLNSPGAGGDSDNTIQEGDIPGQFTRLMTKGRYWDIKCNLANKTG